MRQPGIVSVPDAAAGAASRTRHVAVNVDPREGDPARISAEDFQSAVMRLKDAGASEARAEAKQQEDRQHLWRDVLVLMIAVLAFEGALASRTA